jgi:hypothetical protein
MRTPPTASTRFLVATASLGLVLTACGAPKNDEDTNPTTSPSSNATNDEDGETSGGESESGNDPSVATTNASMTGPAEESGTGDSGSADTISFIQNPDGGNVSNECDIWAQDCPEGEKCMPWDNAGGNSWNATRCSPLDPNPGQPGDACTVEGSGVSGIDDCDLASMCWNVDPETNMGTCVGFCEGSEANPVCPNPGTGCSITNEGVLILCLPFCDPLLQDCSETEACYPEPNGFFCSPDASGEMGLYGDPCEYLNVCDPGLFCADAAAVPGCAGSIGCCSEYCDISDPMPVCMGTGQECTAFYEAGQAPPGYENVGVCVIPQ